MLPLANSRTWVAASLLLIVAVICFSLAPGRQVSVPGNLDKVEHALAYTFLAVWFTGLVARGYYWKIVLALATLGLVMEVLQHVMALGRHGDPQDMAANVLGIGVGVALGTWRTGGWALRVESWLNGN